MDIGYSDRIYDQIDLNHPPSPFEMMILWWFLIILEQFCDDNYFNFSQSYQFSIFGINIRNQPSSRSAIMWKSIILVIFGHPGDPIWPHRLDSVITWDPVQPHRPQLLPHTRPDPGLLRFLTCVDTSPMLLDIHHRSIFIVKRTREIGFDIPYPRLCIIWDQSSIRSTDRPTFDVICVQLSITFLVHWWWVSCSCWLPLLSLTFLIAVIGLSSELYGAIVIVNVVLLTILTHETTDFSIWFLIYELSILTTFTCLTLESRSYRRLYAFSLMVGCSLFSSALFYVIFSMSATGTTLSYSWLATTVAALLLLVKTPAFPFSVWLPEAHVEASWPGSILLAGFSLKFASYASLSFLVLRLVDIDLVHGLVLFSIVAGTLGMCTTSDSKKVVANFSVIHMCATLMASSLLVNTEFLTNYSWHHHSIVTCAVFLVIGFVYATTASRLFRFLIGNSSLLPVLGVLLMVLVSVSLDMPWTPNVVIELGFVASISWNWMLVTLFLYFWAMVVGFVLLQLSSNSNVGSQTDLPVSTTSFLTLSLVAIILAGFAIDCSLDADGTQFVDSFSVIGFCLENTILASRLQEFLVWSVLEETRWSSD